MIALSGFLVGAVLLIVAVLPTLPVSTLVLIPVALVLNIVLGQFVGSTLVPFYLDAIGTVLIAVLAGPAAGAATGALSSIVWSFFNPTVLPFAAGAALIGCLAGLAARYGLFRRFYLVPVAGFLTGIIGGVVSAPVAAFVFGGTSGLATGAIVSAFRSMGDSLLAAITKQALISDPMDKAIVFTLVALLVYALPRRTRLQFPFVRRHRVLAGQECCRDSGCAGRARPPARTPDPPLMRLHPLTSLAAAGSTAVITTAAAYLPLSVAVGAAAVGLSFVGGTANRMLPAAAAVLVPLGLSLLVLHGLFFPEGVTVLAEWGPARVTSEGLQFRRGARGAAFRRRACPAAVLLQCQRARPGGGAVVARSHGTVRLRPGLDPHSACRPSARGCSGSGRRRNPGAW